MALFAAPKGGIVLGRRLYMPPAIISVHAGAPGRFLFITDLHLRPQHTQALAALLKACEGVSADAVFLGGDMAEYDEGLEMCLSAIGQRFKNVPIFAVAGNNDSHVFEGDRQKQQKLYAKYGIEYLSNSCAEFTVNGKKVCVAGREDEICASFEQKNLFKNDDVYRVLLAHEPFEKYLAEKPHLMLCGHTHGGQINLLGVTAYLLFYEKSCRFAALADTKVIGNTTLLVSRGIGWSKLPVRIGARSEIHIID